MKVLIDIERFICSMIEAFPDFKTHGRIPCMYKQALKDQGLEYKNGHIVECQDEIEDAEILEVNKLTPFESKLLQICNTAVQDYIATDTFVISADSVKKLLELAKIQNI